MRIRTGAELKNTAGECDTPFSMYIGAFNSIAWDIS